eukprot:626890-Pleurochrysis_carterae.AAC.1
MRSQLRHATNATATATATATSSARTAPLLALSERATVRAGKEHTLTEITEEAHTRNCTAALMGLLPIRVLALGAVATALQGLVSPQTHLRRARVPQALLTPSEFYAISPPVFSFPAPAPAEATSLSMPLTLLAEDIFGSVFAAGMSIAFATIGTTILLAFIVRGLSGITRTLECFRGASA